MRMCFPVKEQIVKSLDACPSHTEAWRSIEITQKAQEVTWEVDKKIVM